MMVQAGEMPERPSGRIDDLVWGLLRRCWGRNPTERPSSFEVYNTLSSLSSPPQVRQSPQESHTPQGSSTEELPGKLKLNFQSIKVSPDQPKQQFYVKLKYGNMDHATSSTNYVGGSGEHGWNKQEIREIETNKQHYGQRVVLEVYLRGGLMKKDKVWVTGNFSLFGRVNRETSVKLEAGPNSLGSAVVKILLIEK